MIPTCCSYDGSRDDVHDARGEKPWKPLLCSSNGSSSPLLGANCRFGSLDVRQGKGLAGLTGGLVLGWIGIKPIAPLSPFSPPPGPVVSCVAKVGTYDTKLRAMWNVGCSAGRAWQGRANQDVGCSNHTVNYCGRCKLFAAMALFLGGIFRMYFGGSVLCG